MPTWWGYWKGESCISQCLLEWPWVPSNSVTLHFYNSLIRLDWIPWNSKVLGLGTPESLSVITCSTPIPSNSSHAQSPHPFGSIQRESNNLSDSLLLCPSWEAISQLSVHFFVPFTSPEVISFYYSINKHLLSSTVYPAMVSGTIWNAEHANTLVPALGCLKFGWRDKTATCFSNFQNELKAVYNQGLSGCFQLQFKSNVAFS